MSFVRFYTSFCISTNTVSNVRKALKSHSVLFSIEHHLIEWHIEKPMRVVMYGKTLDNVACTMDSPVDRVKCQQICRTLSSLARSVASVWVCECFFLKPLNNRKLGALQVHKRRQQRRQNANTLRSFSFSSIQIGLPLLYLFCTVKCRFSPLLWGFVKHTKRFLLNLFERFGLKRKTLVVCHFVVGKKRCFKYWHLFSTFSMLFSIIHFQALSDFPSEIVHSFSHTHTLPHVIHTYPYTYSHFNDKGAFMIVCIRVNLSCSFAHKLLDTCSQWVDSFQVLFSSHFAF